MLQASWMQLSLAEFSQTSGFSKRWFRFCFKPLLLENHMYFWTNSIWMFLIFLPFNSLKCYYVGVICLGSNVSLLENLWKPLLLGSEANFCLFLSLYIQSELENYGMVWTKGIDPRLAYPPCMDARPSHSEETHTFSAIALLKFLIIDPCK